MKPSPDFLQQIALLLEQEPAAALSVEQRQRERRQSFASRKGFDPSQFFVAPISYRDAFDFVTRHHYSGSFVMDIVRLGMFQDRPFRKPKLVGVAIFGLGAGPKTLKKYLGSLRPLELVRFVLLDDVGYRGETWFLARAFEIIRSSSVRKEALAYHGGRYLLDHPVEGVLAFSDPVPRTTTVEVELPSGERLPPGSVVMPGHVGSIYQSKSGIYAGRGEAHKTNILMPDGSVVDKRQQSKLTSQETGAETVYLKLVQAGARPKRPIESWAAWLGDIKRRPPFRVQVHPGTHAFVWKLAGKRRSLRPGDYPPGHRRPATVAERHSLVAVIRKLEQMERRAKGVEKAWLESEIVELKERLAGLELVRPENWPGYPKKVDEPQVIKGRKNRGQASRRIKVSAQAEDTANLLWTLAGNPKEISRRLNEFSISARRHSTGRFDEIWKRHERLGLHGGELPRDYTSPLARIYLELVSAQVAPDAEQSTISLLKAALGAAINCRPPPNQGVPLCTEAEFARLVQRAIDSVEGAKAIGRWGDSQSMGEANRRKRERRRR